MYTKYTQDINKVISKLCNLLNCSDKEFNEIILLNGQIFMNSFLKDATHILNNPDFPMINRDSVAIGHLFLLNDLDQSTIDFKRKTIDQRRDYVLEMQTVFLKIGYDRANTTIEKEDHAMKDLLNSI